MKIIKKITGNYLETNVAGVKAREIIDRDLRTLCVVFMRLDTIPKISVQRICTDSLHSVSLHEVYSKYDSIFDPNRSKAGTITIYADAICNDVKNNERRFEEEVMKALCHELVHYRQEMNQDINLHDHSKLLFKDGFDFDAYRDSPYEKEAREIGDKLYSILITDSNRIQ